MHSKDAVYVDHHNEFTDGKPELITMHHNGDYSGDVTFVVQHPRVMNSLPGGVKVYNNSTVEVKIPFEVLRDLVADWARNERVSKLEQMDPRDVLLGHPLR